MPCGWKRNGRGSICGDDNVVAVRDLGPAYGKLHMQPVCRTHRDYIDAATKSRRSWRRDDPSPGHRAD